MQSSIEQFLSSELESERCLAITKLSEIEDSNTSSLNQWTILNLLPSRLERVHLASSLKIAAIPGGSWSLCSHLLQDSEQDVAGNAINSMTRSHIRSLAHRAFHFFRSPERPQRILYCLARYCDEANDRRIAETLATTLACDLSDAFLARSFNALYRHGIRNELALKVAMELIESHIDATNMDRKAAVSAITYVFFAGSKDHLSVLLEIQNKITIPELRRLLHWGFQDIALLNHAQELNFSKLSAIQFWERNLSRIEPNFSGYGCFSSQELVDGLSFLDEREKFPGILELTQRVLSLGNYECSNWLAEHPKLGVQLLSFEQSDLVDVWVNHATQKLPSFVNSVLSIDKAALWHSRTPELMALHFDTQVSSHGSFLGEKWLTYARSASWPIAANILLGIFLALENRSVGENTNSGKDFDLLNNLCEELNFLIEKYQDQHPEVKEIILGCLIGSPLSTERITNIIAKCAKSIGWWDLASGFMNTYSSAPIQTLIAKFENIAKNNKQKAMDERSVLTLTRTTALALLNFHLADCDETARVEIFKFCKFAELLDPNRNVATLAGLSDEETHDGDENDSVAADWSGHLVVDRPIARWGAIIESQLASPYADSDETQTKTQLLSEALRTAPHVEKRWIARALARLGTDHAVKALLYQGLQHIDSEFVAHTIRELLHSRHPRAQQSLIRCVGRNTISDDLKLSILEEISYHNSSEILNELRTLEILRLPQHIDDAVRDAVGRVATLIDESESLQPDELEGKVIRLNDQDVDTVIRELLPNHEQLNVDSRAALRTAEMILIQSKSWSAGGMDLSPIVNMHCKAVELVLRESFEPFTDSLLRKGQLSRKLDLLGYARPIPEKMQIFEDALANLPIIRLIPYFSKFKLRKMLRGICLYRPGKRFTLDGPKAFALFFLVVSRNSCPFGLDKLLNLGFKNDKDLFEYIKLIHSLQDSRNRAVHEGLTWDAKDEIESMRAQAFKIIEMTLKICDFLRKNELSRITTPTFDVGA